MLICVVSYPRSGQVWLTRVLAAALNCPVRTYLPQDSGRDVAASGGNRTGEHQVTRAHWLSPEYKPPPDKTIHLVRDPRDLVCSWAHYANCSMIEATERICTSVPWKTFVTVEAQDAVCFVKYEDLLENPVEEVRSCILACGIAPHGYLIKKAVQEESFNSRKNKIQKGDVGWSVDRDHHHLNKGIAGRWREELSDVQIASIETACKEPMERFGYL